MIDEGSVVCRIINMCQVRSAYVQSTLALLQLIPY